MKINFKVLIVVGLIVFIASIFALNQVYASLTIAFVLAYLLDPLVEKIERKGLPRRIGVPIVLFLFFMMLGLTGMLVIPKIIAQGRELVLRLPQAFYSLSASLGPLTEEYLGYNLFSDADKFVASLGDPTTLVKPLGDIVQGIFTHTFKFITALLGLLIIPLMAFYLLMQFPKLYGKFLFVVPPRYHSLVSEIRDKLDAVLGGFIRGQLVVSSILSAYYVVAFAALRLELALVLGLLAGFLNVVPYLGILTVVILTMLIALIHGAMTAKFIAIGIVFAVGMGAEGSFLTPRIVGRKVGLGPLTLIIALLIGGELLGLVGMLLAVPLAAIAKVFLNVFLEHYRDSEDFKKA